MVAARLWLALTRMAPKGAGGCYGSAGARYPLARPLPFYDINFGSQEVSLRSRGPGALVRPLLAATAAGVARQPESPRCRAPGPGGAASSAKVGNCNGFFDPARALLQRHETVISAEVRRIGPALVFKRLWEKEIGCRTAIEQLVAVAGNTQLALCCSARTGLFSHFLPTTCMQLSRWKSHMRNLFPRIAMRVAYGVGQLPRVAWYVGHSLAVRRLADAARQRDGGAARERAHTNAPVPDRRRLYADMAVLLGKTSPT